jgi:hypothetical protein
MMGLVEHRLALFEKAVAGVEVDADTELALQVGVEGEPAEQILGRVMGTDAELERADHGSDRPGRVARREDMTGYRMVAESSICAPCRGNVPIGMILHACYVSSSTTRSTVPPPLEGSHQERRVVEKVKQILQKRRYSSISSRICQFQTKIRAVQISSTARNPDNMMASTGKSSRPCPIHATPCPASAFRSSWPS